MVRKFIKRVLYLQLWKNLYCFFYLLCFLLLAVTTTVALWPVHRTIRLRACARTAMTSLRPAAVRRSPLPASHRSRAVLQRSLSLPKGLVAVLNPAAVQRSLVPVLSPVTARWSLRPASHRSRAVLQRSLSLPKGLVAVLSPVAALERCSKVASTQISPTAQWPIAATRRFTRL